MKGLDVDDGDPESAASGELLRGLRIRRSFAGDEGIVSAARLAGQCVVTREILLGAGEGGNVGSVAVIQLVPLPRIDALIVRGELHVVHQDRDLLRSLRTGIGKCRPIGGNLVRKDLPVIGLEKQNDVFGQLCHIRRSLKHEEVLCCRHLDDIHASDDHFCDTLREVA